MKYTIYLFLIFAALTSCNSTDTKTSSNKKKETTKTKGAALPFLEDVTLLKIYDECEGIDITYYDYPVSMSSNAENTKSFIAMISQEVMYSDQLMKKPTGIMNFNINGDIFIDAEFYLNIKNRSGYFKFIRGKESYYHPIKENGISVFMQPIDMVKQKTQ